MSQKQLKDYKILATLTSNNNISIFVASCKGKKNQLYAINKIPKENKSILNDFFSYYQSNNRCKEMKDLFTIEDYIYIIFEYTQAETLEKCFRQEKNIYTLEERKLILQNILIKISNLIDTMPLNLLISIIRLENISIDQNKDFHFIYNLSSIISNNKADIKILFKNLSSIIKAVFDVEIKEKKLPSINLIIDKCNFGLYKSIPELIVDLNNNLKNEKKFNKFSLLKSAYIKKYEKKIKTIKRAKIPVASIAVIALISYWLIFAGSNTTLTNFTLGQVEYNFYLNKDYDQNIQAFNYTQPAPKPVQQDLSIPSSLKIDFDDYIIKAGDTLESICKVNYPSTDFISTIKSFNNISSDSDLKPGNIIKLPNQTAVTDHFSK